MIENLTVAMNNLNNNEILIGEIIPRMLSEFWEQSKTLFLAPSRKIELSGHRLSIYNQDEEEGGYEK